MTCDCYFGDDPCDRVAHSRGRCATHNSRWYQGERGAFLNRPLASTVDSVKPRPFYQPKGRLQRSLEEISLAQARVSIEQEESLYAAGFIVSFVAGVR